MKLSRIRLIKTGCWNGGKIAELFFCVLTQSGPVADICQPEKSLSQYRSFRFLNFQRCHWQQPTQTGKWDLFFETR